MPAEGALLSPACGREFLKRFGPGRKIVRVLELALGYQSEEQIRGEASHSLPPLPCSQIHSQPFSAQPCAPGG